MLNFWSYKELKDNTTCQFYGIQLSSIFFNLLPTTSIYL